MNKIVVAQNRLRNRLKENEFHILFFIFTGIHRGLKTKHISLNLMQNCDDPNTRRI